MYLKEPLFIVVDGPDGCGKTTLINGIAKYLQNDVGQDVITMRALGQGRIGMECRQRHLTNQTGPGFESLMMPMSIMEAYYDHVLPTLAGGKCVIMDRWIASFFAYQVQGREDLYSKEIYDTLFDNERTPMLRQPDIYFIGQVDPEIANKRLNTRQENSNYLDQETNDFKKRVDNGFKLYAKQNQSVVEINCNLSQATVFETVRQQIILYVEKQRNNELMERRRKAQQLEQKAYAL